MGWLQDPQAASSLGRPRCEVGVSRGAGLVWVFGSCVGRFVVALPRLWELSVLALEIALRFRSLQCLVSPGCSGPSFLILHPRCGVGVTKPALAAGGTVSREGREQHNRGQQCKDSRKKMLSQHRRGQNNIKLGEGQWLERGGRQMRARGCKVGEIYLLFPELHFFPS